MIETHPEYLTDDDGNRKAVVVPIGEWEHIQELLDELQDIREYDEAKARVSEPIPLNEAIETIASTRK